MSHLQSQGTYFIAGTNTLYVPAGRKRYVDKTVCKPWPDLNGDIRLLNPGEAARIELAREWPDLKRVGWRGGMIGLLKWRSPLHYSGQYVGPMIYIDLDGAYSQIYERFWLDTSYPRGYYGQYPLWDVAQRLKVWKSARNSLVGITRSTEAVAYRGTNRIVLKTKNKYLSPGLWASVQTTLHWIMNKAIELGAIYGNVDGYIFPLPSWAFVEDFTEWLSDNQVKWSIRAQGSGEVVCWNNYRIGQVRTKANQLNLKHKSKEFTNVSDTNADEWAAYWKNCGEIARLRRGRREQH